MRKHDGVGTRGFAIEEAGLILRPWRPTDADQVFRACQDPTILRWTSLPQPYQRHHAEGYVAELSPTLWQAGTAAPMGVFDPAGQLLGAMGLISLQRGQAAEVGYWVAPWARGRGVATNALRALARWALRDLGIQRLAWRAEVGNHASRLVAETVGFQVEGIARHGAQRPGGVRIDCWSGSLVPGQLREAGVPLDPVRRLRAITFGAAQPRLDAVTDQGNELSLRPFRVADTEAVTLACQDPESARWTTIPDPYRREDADYYIREYAPGRWARGDAAIFALADDRDAFVGSMDLRLGPAVDVADVGYLVAPWARGRGYASAALRAVATWGTVRLGVNRVEWRAYVGNEASRRVAEKAGFTVEGTARSGCLQRGQYRDAWTGALLATDLLATDPPASYSPATRPPDLPGLTTR
jgi:RimJ/RimL family protein N-acetyltransferase